MTPAIARYDLHLHTGWSYDATASVRSYFEAARRLGVSCIAITDHHLADSLDEVHAAARDFPEVRAIPAAELTVTTELGVFDLLCYGLPADPPGELRAVLEAYRRWQQENGASLCAGVAALGLAFTERQRIELLAGYRSAAARFAQGATHVRNAVLRDYFISRGFIPSAEAYAPFMERVRMAVPGPPYPDVARVVPAVKAAGMLVAVAHPYHYFRQYDEARMDAIRELCTLDGIECAHPSVPPEYGRRYRAYCERHGLFSTGGSDCHDEAGIDPSFGRHGGSAEWLDEILARLDGAGACFA